MPVYKEPLLREGLQAAQMHFPEQSYLSHQKPFHLHPVISTSAFCFCRLRVPPPHTHTHPLLLFFLPLMDFHLQFSRKAVLLASFLIHLSHPTPYPPVSWPSLNDSCGHLCSCPLGRKVSWGWLITGRTWVWKGDEDQCEPPTHPCAAADGPALWFSDLAVRVRGRGHYKEFQGRTMIDNIRRKSPRRTSQDI